MKNVINSTSILTVVHVKIHYFPPVCWHPTPGRCKAAMTWQKNIYPQIKLATSDKLIRCDFKEQIAPEPSGRCDVGCGSDTWAAVWRGFWHSRWEWISLEDRWKRVTLISQIWRSRGCKLERYKMFTRRHRLQSWQKRKKTYLWKMSHTTTGNYGFAESGGKIFLVGVSCRG